MAEGSRPGIGRRRPRLSESETRTRTLHTAVAAFQETGLTVSLEHISIEDVIREAGVSRTAVYRLWPHKDLFIGDLILELAETAIPVENTRGAEATGQIRAFVLPRLDDLIEPTSRWPLACELVVAASSPDFEQTASLAGQWRTYFALVMTVMNLPDDELRAKARGAISSAERRYRDRLAENYRIVAGLLGFRLADPEDIDFGAVANLMIAMVRGLILHNQTLTSSADQNSALLGAGVTAILSQCFEIDPTVIWGSEQIKRLRVVLTDSENLFDGSDAKSV